MKSNAEDRIAVARSVVTNIFVVVFAVLGLVATIVNLVIKPETTEILNRIAILESNQETMKRSNATHFGQIKSLHRS